MIEVSDLISKVRYILVDAPGLQEASGWDDKRLLDLIDEAQKDICIQSRIFKREHYVSLTQGSYTYPLPEDLISIDRVTDSSKNVPTKSMSDLDEVSVSWRTDEGDSILAIIQDAVNMNHLEVYPKPSSDLTFVPFYTLGFIDGGYTLILNDAYGVTTDTDYPTTIDMLGLTTDVTTIFTPKDFSETYFGIITDILDSDSLDSDSRELIVSTISLSSSYGVVSDVVIEGVPNFSGYFGGITDVAQSFGLLGETWGVVASAANANAVLKVRYSALAQTLKFTESTLSLPDKWATAIKYYVSAYALLDDNDAKNNEKGVAFEARYQKELLRLLKLGYSTDPARSATSYRSMQGSKINNEDY